MAVRGCGGDGDQLCRIETARDFSLRFSRFVNCRRLELAEEQFRGGDVEICHCCNRSRLAGITGSMRELPSAAMLGQPRLFRYNS